MIDYNILTHRDVSPHDVGELVYDIFISSFNSSERVQHVFHNVDSSRKIWLIHPEYQYGQHEIPVTEDFYMPSDDSLEPTLFWFEFLEQHLPSTGIEGLRICVDITGMMRPHLLVMPLIFRMAGLATVDCIYSDPASYVGGNQTLFAKGPVTHVAQIGGLEGNHSTPSGNDLLIIGAGYDRQLIEVVANDKKVCRHKILVGLPSLQPHMYQENRSQVGSVSDALNSYGRDSFLYSPANNPFVTAQVLSEEISAHRATHGEKVNVYLSPVGSKSQVLGFGWYFLCQARSEATSVIFPFAEHYSRETSTGITRVGVFKLELDWIEID